MNDYGYFNNENYTGSHLHIDNYKNEFTPYIEAIAWERQDKTMVILFDDFENEKEFNTLFGAKERFYDDFMGGFLGNVKTDEQAYEMFRNWVGNEYRIF